MVSVVFSLVSTAQYLYVAWTEYSARSLPECLGKPELHNLLRMYPLVWYDLTREQHSRSKGRGGRLNCINFGEKKRKGDYRLLRSCNLASLRDSATSTRDTM